MTRTTTRAKTTTSRWRATGLVWLGASILGLVPATAARAVEVPFTEHFDLDVAGWEDNPGLPLFFESSGGPDDSSFASADFDFADFVEPFPGAGPIVFRAHDEDAASDLAFVGDWDAAGVIEVRAWVRHDAPVDMSWILRIANTTNFPAAAFDAVDPVVPPDTWTELVFEVDADSPYCTPESFSPSFTCADALMNVAHLQLGTDAPAALIEGEVLVMLDVDQVSLVPEPGTLASTAVGLLGVAALSRRRVREGGRG